MRPCEADECETRLLGVILLHVPRHTPANKGVNVLFGPQAGKRLGREAANTIWFGLQRPQVFPQVIQKPQRLQVIRIATPAADNLPHRRQVFGVIETDRVQRRFISVQVTVRIRK